MRITFIVDARSAIARSWIQNVVESGYVAQVLSTYPVPDGDREGVQLLPTFTAHESALAARALVPVATAARAGILGRKGEQTVTPAASGLPDVLFRARVLGEVALRRPFSNAFHAALDEFRPDVVHALRIPFEAVLAAQAMSVRSEPFVISVWGNDLSYQTERSARLGRATRRSLGRADGLLADCRRDIRLAREMGYRNGRPTYVIPGSGGLDLSRFRPGPPSEALLERLGVSQEAPVVLNPRGFRSYVDNDAFLRSIPIVLGQRPDTVFLMPGMATNARAVNYVRRSNLGRAVRLMPHVPFDEMPDLYRIAKVVVSPSLHDGTPNTLLEAMACGALPVLGDVSSLREWIEPEDNGLLVHPITASTLATATIRALSDDAFALRARRKNWDLVRERADRQLLRAPLAAFYDAVRARVSGG